MVATIFVRRIESQGIGRRTGPAARRLADVRSIDAMLGPTRPLPRPGAKARVAHFGGGFEPATVVAVADGGRRVEVTCEGGETLVFELNPATARFVAAGGGHGPRLELLD